MHIFLTILYTALLCLLIFRWKFTTIEGFNKKTPVLLFIIKVSAGILLWLIHAHFNDHSTGYDIHAYFNDASVFYKAFQDKPSYFFKLFFGDDQIGSPLREYILQTNRWSAGQDAGIINDNRLLIRLNAIIYFFSFGYFHVHTVFMCFFSFLGMTALYKGFNKIINHKKKAILILSFLIPSVLLWSSGVMKESILIFSLGFVILFSLKLRLEKFKLINLTGLLIGFAATLYAKSYVAFALFPGLIFLLSSLKLNPKKMLVSFLLIHLLIGVTALNVHHFTHLSSPLSQLENKQEAFFSAVESAQPRSAIEIPDIEPQLPDFAYSAPQAIANTLLRPYPWEVKSLLYAFATIENLLFIILLLTAALFFKIPGNKTLSFLLFSCSFVIALSLLIGWVTPIMGAIVRYKVPLLPFYGFIFIALINKEKLTRKVPFTKYLI